MLRRFFFVLLLCVFLSKGRYRARLRMHVWACVPSVSLILIGYVRPIPFALAFGEREAEWRFNRLKWKGRAPRTHKTRILLCAVYQYTDVVKGFPIYLMLHQYQTTHRVDTKKSAQWLSWWFYSDPPSTPPHPLPTMCGFLKRLGYIQKSVKSVRNFCILEVHRMWILFL